MVVFEKYKLVFIHVPKCAGTSVEYIMCRNPSKFQKMCQQHLKRKYRGINNVIRTLYFYHPWFRTFVLWLFNFLYRSGRKYNFCNRINLMNHTSITTLLKYNQINPSYKRFAIVRNPYTRMVSIYKHFSPLKISFEKMCIAAENEIERFRQNKMYSINVFFLPQTCFLCDKHMNVLVDDTLHFEHLARDWSSLVEKYNLSTPQLPLFNKSKRDSRDKKIIFTPRAARIVQRLYKNDFVVFGYSTDRSIIRPLKVV